MNQVHESLIYIAYILKQQNQVITYNSISKAYALGQNSGDCDIHESIAQMIQNKLIRIHGNALALTENGNYEALKISKKKAKDEFESKIGRLSRSSAYLDFCEEAYGYRMYLFNMMDREQLDFLFNKVLLNKNHTIIDAGCGVGSIIDALAMMYECNGIGIDLLSKSIIEKDLRRATYIEGDIDNLTEYPLKPDVILSVDSLYFCSNLEKLIQKMTAYHNCRYYFYYSQYIFDDANEDKSVIEMDNTRIAKALQWNSVPYSAINYSENERNFYDKCIDILPKYEPLFRNEENHDLYLSKMNEFKLGRELYEKNVASRYLYMGVL